MARHKSLLRQVWEILNGLSPSSLIEEGRVYGGGLHKLEPKELANVDATPILDTFPSLRQQMNPIQLDLFEQVTA